MNPDDIRAFFYGAWRSRTVWTAGLLGILGSVESEFGILAPYLPQNAYAHVMVTCSVLMLILRIFTTDGIVDKIERMQERGAKENPGASHDGPGQGAPGEAREDGGSGQRER